MYYLSFAKVVFGNYFEGGKLFRKNDLFWATTTGLVAQLAVSGKNMSWVLKNEENIYVGENLAFYSGCLIHYVLNIEGGGGNVTTKNA